MNDLLQSMDQWGPEKIVCVSDARTGMRGVLVVDNTARGTGKGGMAVALHEEFELPTFFAGLGEQPDDLQPFSPEFYTAALFGGAE